MAGAFCLFTAQQLDELRSPVGKENLPPGLDADVRGSHLSALRCSFSSAERSPKASLDCQQMSESSQVKRTSIIGGGTASEVGGTFVAPQRSTSVDLSFSPANIGSPEFQAHRGPDSTLISPTSSLKANNRPSGSFKGDSEKKAVRRLSKRLSMTRCPSQFGEFTYDNGVYKLFVSPTDRSRPLLMKQATYDKLYDYQREGVKWLWERYCMKAGGLLGDDMGLGKTIQIITFLDGMFHAQRIRYALIVMPVSLFENWSAEIEKWAPKLLVERLHDVSVDRRRQMLRQLRLYGGVCLTSYGLITSNLDVFQDAGIRWDYVILDEGHKIKNPSIQLSRNIRKIDAIHRVILSGTPVQNNLTELWALFDFICKGKLLGSRNEFKELVADKITRGNERCASEYDKIRGEELAKILRDLIQPYFLRRDKKTVLCKQSISGQPLSSSPTLEAVKYDFVIWLKMTPVQMEIYQRLLSTNFVTNAINSEDKKASFTAFQALSLLKLVCDHPWLMLNDSELQEALHRVKWQGIDAEDSVKFPVPVLRRMVQDEKESEGYGCSMIQDCIKMSFTCKLLTFLHKQGHRVLVFSHSLKMLDILEFWLRCMSIRHARIDGSVTKSSDRQKIVDTFNADSSIFCCLLTTQVGGIGLTLTGADRVLIVDPDWNPSVDNQAIDRAYRISQTKDVVVYRLITCGTLEEKIYRHQVFKQGLAMNAMGSESIYRHFTRKDLKEMFELGVTTLSQTADQLYDLNHDKMKYPESIEAHMMRLREIKGTANFSDHGLVFDKKEELGTCVEAQVEAATSRRRLKSSTYEPSLEVQQPKKRGRPVSTSGTSSPTQAPKPPKVAKATAVGKKPKMHHKEKLRLGHAFDEETRSRHQASSLRELCASPPASQHFEGPSSGLLSPSRTAGTPNQNGRLAEEPSSSANSEALRMWSPPSRLRPIQRCSPYGSPPPCLSSSVILLDDSAIGSPVQRRQALHGPSSSGKAAMQTLASPQRSCWSSSDAMAQLLSSDSMVQEGPPAKSDTSVDPNHLVADGCPSILATTSADSKVMQQPVSSAMAMPPSLPVDRELNFAMSPTSSSSRQRQASVDLDEAMIADDCPSPLRNCGSGSPPGSPDILMGDDDSRCESACLLTPCPNDGIGLAGPFHSELQRRLSCCVLSPPTDQHNGETPASHHNTSIADSTLVTPVLMKKNTARCHLTSAGGTPMDSDFGPSPLIRHSSHDCAENPAVRRTTGQGIGMEIDRSPAASVTSHDTVQASPKDILNDSLISEQAVSPPVCRQPETHDESIPEIPAKAGNTAEESVLANCEMPEKCLDDTTIHQNDSEEEEEEDWLAVAVDEDEYLDSAKRLSGMFPKMMVKHDLSGTFEDSSDEEEEP